MFGPCDSEILEHVADYKINLMEPLSITEEELNHYTTGLRSVIKYVKYSNDLKKLREALNEDASYQELDEETAEAIEAVSGKNLNLKPEGGVVNMCKALDDLEKEAKAEILYDLVEEGTITIEKAAEKAGMNVEGFMVIVKKLKKSSAVPVAVQC